MTIYTLAVIIAGNPSLEALAILLETPTLFAGAALVVAGGALLFVVLDIALVARYFGLEGSRIPFQSTLYRQFSGILIY